MSDAEMDVEETVRATDLTDSEVTSKYQVAAGISNKTIQGIIMYAKPGMKIGDCCVFGDSLITQQCSLLYKKNKNLEKGIAFPTCLSVNDCVCHYSPLASEESPVLKEGDVVKVDVGTHIDGYIAVAAHTFIVRAEGTTGPISGPGANVVLAAYTAAEAAIRLMKPGVNNHAVTDIIQKVAADFGVNSVQGVLMHELKRFVIDGNNVVIQRKEAEQQVDTFEFEQFKTYTVDVVMSTGEGKPIERDARTTVFKRAVDHDYQLKMKASRLLLSEVNKRFATFPFSLRSVGDERQARLGVVECCKHDLFTAYPVLFEKPGDLVAHFKYTVLLLPSGTAQITGGLFNAEDYTTDKVISDEVKETLAIELRKKKKKKNAAGAPAPAAAPAAPMETE